MTSDQSGRLLFKINMHLSRFWFLLSLIGCIACTETSTVGNELIGDDNFVVSYVDTVTAKLYTVKFDSIVTSTTGQIVVGHNTDPYMGDLNVTSYFLVTPGSYSPRPAEHYFDSITVALYPNYFYDLQDGVDTYANIYIDQLSDELTTDYGEDSYLYNVSRPPGNGVFTQLGYKYARLRSDLGERIEVRLDDAFGEELFELIENDDAILSDDYGFPTYLKGFRVRMDSTIDTPFLGFDTDSVRLILYYTDAASGSATEKTFEFDMDIYYTYFKNTPTTALADIINSDDAVASKDLDNVGVICGGIGYALRVDLPYIRNLLIEGKDYLITYAILKLIPENTDYDYRDLPDTLPAYVIEHDVLSTSSQLGSMYLSYDPGYPGDTYYYIDLTDYVATLLDEDEEYFYSLLFTLNSTDYKCTIDYVELGDMNFESELILYTVENSND